SKAALEGLLTFTRNTLRSIDQQSSALCEHYIAVAEQERLASFRQRDPRITKAAMGVSMAVMACAAKFLTSLICLSVNSGAVRQQSSKIPGQPGNKRKFALQRSRRVSNDTS